VGWLLRGVAAPWGGCSVGWLLRGVAARWWLLGGGCSVVAARWWLLEVRMSDEFLLDAR
jgi:hypothetical protein